MSEARGRVSRRRRRVRVTAPPSPMKTTAFRVIEDPEGAIIEADVDTAGWMLERLNAGIAPIRFEGKTFDGGTVIVTGPFLLEETPHGMGGGPPWKLHYAALGGIELTRPAGVASSLETIHARFELGNLIFEGETSTDYEFSAGSQIRNAWAKNALTMTVAGRRFEIVQFLDYSAKAKALESGRSKFAPTAGAEHPSHRRIRSPLHCPPARRTGVRAADARPRDTCRLVSPHHLSSERRGVIRANKHCTDAAILWRAAVDFTFWRIDPALRRDSVRRSCRPI